MESSWCDWDRRAFLAAAAACCTAPLIAGSRRLINVPNLYVVESGIYGFDPYFSTGVLVVRNPLKHLNRILQIRYEFQYYTNFSYASNDYYKFDFVKALMASELNDPDVQFVTRVQRAGNAHGPAYKVKRSTHIVGADSPYQSAYRDMFQRTLASSTKVVMHVSNRTTTGDDRFFYNFLTGMFPSLADLWVVHTRENDLMQLAAFYTGCVHRDLTSQVPANSGQIKHALINELKRQLGVADFTAPSLTTSQKFKVIRV
jgi:hypothetical protein